MLVNLTFLQVNRKKKDATMTQSTSLGLVLSSPVQVFSIDADITWLSSLLLKMRLHQVSDKNRST